jgi:hypothetical protein
MSSTARFEQERRAAREAALVHLRPDLGALAVTGKDRLSWLNGLVTCELAGLEPGAGTYGLAVGKTGKIAAELWFIAEAERVLMVMPQGRMETIREHFDRHLIMEDAEMSDLPGSSVIFTHGPRSPDLVAAARAAGASAALIDWTGRGDAAAILAPQGSLDAVKATLLARAGDAGAEASDEGWEALRIAWGLPRAGVDYDESSLPQEASLEKLGVCFTKGCYLGQETVFMLEKRGHAKKRLMRLEIEGDDPLPAGAEIVLPGEGSVIGAVTSATPRPDGGGLLALGHVKYKHAVKGTVLGVAGRVATVLGQAAEPLGA